MYITEDLVIEVVSGIFIEANAKMHSYLMILMKEADIFIRSKQKRRKLCRSNFTRDQRHSTFITNI